MNLLRAQILYIHKMLEFFVVYKYEKFMFATF